MLRTLVVLVFCVALAMPHSAHAQSVINCPSGKTYGDISAALKARGVNVPAGVIDCKDNAALLGLDCAIGDPIPFLQQRKINIPEYEISRMGSTFACNLARFIDAGEKAGSVIRIYSGARNFRNPGAGADCQRVPCVPSTHELGCAADLTFNGARQVEAPQCPGNSACVWAHKNANTYGLQFRLVAENGFRKPEPWHIEISGAQGPANLNSQGYCPGSTGTPFTAGVPSGSPFSSPTTFPSAPPAAPAPPISCPAGYLPIGGQCIPQQTFTTQSPMSYIDTSSTSSPSASGIPASPPSNSGPSVIDMINSIATPSSTSKTAATGTSVGLIDALADRSGLKATTPDTKASTTYQGAPAALQTFVSSDLSQGSSVRTTSLWMLLENIRVTLVTILAKLQPFGGARQRSGGSEELE